MIKFACLKKKKKMNVSMKDFIFYVEWIRIVFIEEIYKHKRCSPLGCPMKYYSILFKID